jgi:SAM-dependent methyltransferase
MKFSIFTPVHKMNEGYLNNLFDSLVAQSYDQDFEWLVVLNGDITYEQWGKWLTSKSGYSFTINWIRSETTGNVGQLKKQACEKANGEICIELDWDDMLTPDALQELDNAFSDPNVVFAYSNSAQFEDGTWLAERAGKYPYSNYWGWNKRKTSYKGHDLWEMVAFEPTAHSIRRIEWAPNHVRAWRKDAYLAIGGHDANIALGDDHDLVCRFYIAYGQKGFAHIDKCIYIYRAHTENTCKVRNGEVQQQVGKNYNKYINDLATRWATDNGLRKLDLGGRFNAWKGYETVDLLDADIVMDLNEDWDDIPDNSVGVIKAYHIIEHLKDPIHFFNEAYRVLAPGGFLLIEVPSTNGMGAWCDPTHISFFNTHSFEYYTNEKYGRFIRPMYKGKFQKARVFEYWWTEPKLPVVRAELICLKDEYKVKHVGEILM